jgi:hypothetical protein
MKYRADGMGERRVEASALVLLAGAVLAALVIFFKQHAGTGNGKNRGSPGKTISGRKRKARIGARNPYAARFIMPGNNPCETAQRFSAKKYLVNEAPKLPLQGCDRAHCQCKFMEHNDRRESHEDRRNPCASSLTTQLFEATGEPNRRQRQGGRRKSDWA